MKEVRHPIQPIITDKHGVVRFKENKIIRYLLDHGGISLNDLAQKDFSVEDREQLAMLIGYSLSGFSELSYVTDDTYNLAQAAYEAQEKGEDVRDTQIATLRRNRAYFRKILRGPISAIYGIAEEDLGGEE